MAFPTFFLMAIKPSFQGENKMGLHSSILFWVRVFFFCCFWAGGGFRCVGTWMVEKIQNVVKSLKTMKDEASSRANALKDKLPGDAPADGRNVLVELKELRGLVLQLQASISDIQGAISTNSEICGNDHEKLVKVLSHLKIDGNPVKE